MMELMQLLVTWEKPEGSEARACRFLGEVSQEAGTANAKALRLEDSGQVQGTAKRPVWLERSE